MWNNTIPAVGETYYNFALWFLIYSVLGWVVESIYMSLCNKKITNRGFIHGPICPIYGFGGILVHTALQNFQGNMIALFISGSVLATVVEFLVAKVMIRVFGCLWWDYSNKAFNYKGIICLESCVAWGLYTIIEFAFLKHIVFMLISWLPVKTGKIIVISALTYYIFDFTFCAIKVHRGEVSDEENNIMQIKSN